MKEIPHNAAGVLDSLQDFDGSFLDWIDSQVTADRYGGTPDATGARIVAIDLDVW